MPPAQTQSTAAAAPPAQTLPDGHPVQFDAEDAPAAQKNPAAHTHGSGAPEPPPHHCPPVHGPQPADVAPAAQKLPAAQAHAPLHALVLRPRAAPNAPGGQRTGAVAFAGQ